MTSAKLCGGISVAYPAEIPVAPLTKRLGKAAGKTVGSFSVSSKFQANGTVFFQYREASSQQSLTNVLQCNAWLPVDHLHRTIVTMHFNQGFTIFPILTHSHHSVINREITVWVEITHNVTDRFCRFTKTLIKSIAVLVHRIKDTTLNRLQTITNIWQSRS